MRANQKEDIEYMRSVWKISNVLSVLHKKLGSNAQGNPWASRWLIHFLRGYIYFTVLRCLITLKNQCQFYHVTNIWNSIQIAIFEFNQGKNAIKWSTNKPSIGAKVNWWQLAKMKKEYSWHVPAMKFIGMKQFV